MNQGFLHPLLTLFTVVIVMGASAEIIGLQSSSRDTTGDPSWTPVSEWGHVTNSGPWAERRSGVL